MLIFQRRYLTQDHRSWMVGVAFALLALLVVSGCSQSGESQYATDWGPSIGTTAPLLEATDQAGNQQNLASLTGSKGLLVVFNRSVDW